MYGVRRRKVDWHRIQGGQAIVSVTLYEADRPIAEGGQVMEWVGDAYALRDELNEAIRVLEEKQARRNGSYQMLNSSKNDEAWDTLRKNAAAEKEKDNGTQ